MLKIVYILAKLYMCMTICHHFREKQKYNSKTYCGTSFIVEKYLIKYSLLTKRVKKLYYSTFILNIKIVLTINSYLVVLKLEIH